MALSTAEKLVIEFKQPTIQLFIRLFAVTTAFGLTLQLPGLEHPLVAGIRIGGAVTAVVVVLVTATLVQFGRQIEHRLQTAMDSTVVHGAATLFKHLVYLPAVLIAYSGLHPLVTGALGVATATYDVLFFLAGLYPVTAITLNIHRHLEEYTRFTTGLLDRITED